MFAPDKASLACVFMLALCLFSMGSAQSDNFKILPVTYYDFQGTHADFELPTCAEGPRVQGTIKVGMVQDTLGAGRKPLLNPGQACNPTDLPNWFRSKPGTNTRYCKSLTLAKRPGSLSTYEYSNPRFFPLDSVPTNEKIYKGGDQLIHNFHFCMEMHATFQYRGGEVFDFLGDDDVWVFVNNKLALDLGGLHQSLPGQVNLDTQKDNLKISLGKYYNFDFFFCERQTSESDMKVTTDIDILPPPAIGFHITDVKLNLLGAGDTLTLNKGGASATLNSVMTATETQNLDCADVASQVKTPISGNWTLGTTPLTPGASVTINPDLIKYGLYKLIFEKDGLKDSLWVKIIDLPTAAVPVANPPSRAYTGTLSVTLTTSTLEAVIHYTLDGTTPTDLSPVYGPPLMLLGTTTVQAIAIKPSFNASPVMVAVYTKILASALLGYYQDLDGDGKIETAVVLFDAGFATPPQKVLFTDPFNPTLPLAPMAMVPGVVEHSMVYTLPPFTAGTGFGPGNFGLIVAEANVFSGQPIVMGDSVGPVLKAARSIPSANVAVKASVEVEFSEPVALDIAAKVFPFETKRGNSLVAPSAILVSTIIQISPTLYRFTFMEGSKYPVPMDSLRIASVTVLVDDKGNGSHMKFFIPVTGDPAMAKMDLQVGLIRGLTQGMPLFVHPTLNPVVVHGNKVCANCGDAGVRELLPSQEPALLSGLGPTWRVKSKYPFSYSLYFYDNLGQFVNRAEGNVDPVRFEALRAFETVQDSVQVDLTFLPVSRSGNTIATGAYVMKGLLKVQNQPGLKGPQGESVVLTPSETKIVSRFGYMRKLF
jgi:fibro-slime domain-containing protein